jgi:hypothetical protein
MLKLARQPPTIVTRAELHFYDLPLIRPSGFLNSANYRGSMLLERCVSLTRS